MDMREQKILDCMKKVVPVMTEEEREKLLAFGEGMAFMAAQRPGRPDAGTRT